MTKRSFGQITRLPSRRFRARYTGPDMALHNAPTTFETRQDAEGWLTDERRLISGGNWVSPASRRAADAKREADRKARNFDAYARSWLDARHDLRPTTRVGYACSIERHLIPAFGSTPIDDIRTEDVRAWFTRYGSRTPTARAHAFAVLKSILKQAEDDELIVRNPARIKAGGRAEAQRDPQVLTLPELLALADAMPPQHRALTLLCGFCGLRFGEAVALKRGDVDLDEGFVHIAHGMTRVNGQKVIGKPKTKAAVRKVAVPKMVVEALRTHLASTDVGRNALVFPGKDGQPLAPSALYGRAARTERRGKHTFEKTAYGFFAAREVIGRPELHWHDLRRTAATLGAQSGATVREMQHRLGHTTPAMALHYQGATEARDRLIADQLDRMAQAVESTQSDRVR
jgi:integrase